MNLDRNASSTLCVRTAVSCACFAGPGVTCIRRDRADNTLWIAGYSGSSHTKVSVRLGHRFSPSGRGAGSAAQGLEHSLDRQVHRRPDVQMHKDRCRDRDRDCTAGRKDESPEDSFGLCSVLVRTSSGCCENGSHSACIRISCRSSDGAACQVKTGKVILRAKATAWEDGGVMYLAAVQTHVASPCRFSRDVPCADTTMRDVRTDFRVSIARQIPGATMPSDLRAAAVVFSDPLFPAGGPLQRFPVNAAFLGATTTVQVSEVELWDQRKK